MQTDPPSGGSLEAFVRNEGQGLLNFAFLVTGGRAEAAQDLVQTVLTRLVSRGIEDLADVRTYSRRAVVNEHRSMWRRDQAQHRAMGRITRRQDDSNEGSRTEDLIVVLEALSTLNWRERAAIVLRYYEDLPDEEIARVIGASRSTVRSLIHRALPKLRDYLAPVHER